jgi:RND family efflux transporter MFP subunit
MRPAFFRRIGWWMLFLLGGTALLAAACSSKKKEKEKSIPNVQVTRVSRMPAHLSLTYMAALRGSVEVRVFSQVPDRIRSLRVDEGDRVRRGQILAVISHDVLSSGQEAALAGLESAKANMESLRLERDRIAKLYKAQAVGEAQMVRIEKQVQSTEAQVRRLEAMVSQASTQQSKAFVQAPIDGIIGERFLEEGDMAAPGVPIVTVVRMEELKAELKVPEFELSQIEAAIESKYPVWIRVAGTLDAAGERVPIPARIVRVSPTIDLTTRMATVEVRVDNKEKKLKPGMLAEVEVVVQQKNDALLVPAYAVLAEGKVGAAGSDLAYVVYTVEKNQARRNPVKLGMQVPKRKNGGRDMVEITDGLEEGALVVQRGQHMLRDGDQVEVVNMNGGKKPGAGEAVGAANDGSANP